ncbi:hypothetical protein [Arthrobacter sp. B1805]|uniref:hypothetical protein n=1 Tax=Arthrobacter sp. B1805 TaxID=2058892 RepID=UPI0011B0DEAB|nr:hypothetical protein [Arthrobacter sp. B1805]
MSKLSIVIASAAITVLLTACSSSASDQPDAGSVAAAPTGSSSVSASPDPSPTLSAAPSADSSAEPSLEPGTPPQEASPEAVPPAVEAPVLEPPVVEATPTAPEAPAVVIATDPVWDAVRATVRQGSSFTITGTGYQPGQQVVILMGISQSDGMVMDEQRAITDAAGNYSFTISVAPDLAPRTYAVLTYVDDGVNGGPQFEASKRFALIDVVAA